MPSRRRVIRVPASSRPVPDVGRPIVVVGASAGGIEALRTLTANVPGDLPAALFVVLHIGATSLSVLAEILSRSGDLPATSAKDGEPIRTGRIYVAPPDHHLLLAQGTLHLTRGPKEHRFRPAIDPLFRSAASIYGSRVVGVILSGTLADGAIGLHAVKAAGGLAVVQDPRDALFDSMPLRALEAVSADHCLPAAQMGALLSRVCREYVGGSGVPMTSETWTPSQFSCPDCGGVLSQSTESQALGFRCHVGHRFDGESLRQAYAESVERVMYAGARVLAEKASLLRDLGGRARATARPAMARRLEAEAATYDQRRDTLLRACAAELPAPEPGETAMALPSLPTRTIRQR